MLADASQVTIFRPGPGRDITDVVLGAEVTGYRGSCHYDYEKKKMNVIIQVAMDVRKGPAATGPAAFLRYFVAVPGYYPSPQAKSVFAINLRFTENADRMHILDNEVQLDLPVQVLKDDYPKMDVYIGLQLDQEELDYNRAHPSTQQ